MRTKEEIARDISQCDSLPEIDDLLKDTTLEEFYLYHHAFLFGAYLLGLNTGKLAKEEFDEETKGGVNGNM